MPTRPNPYYYAGGYANPGMSQIADTLAAIFAPRTPSPQDQAQMYQRTMSGNQSAALAGKYAAETQGIQLKNDAMASPPKMLAELFLQGGQFMDDPMLRNPNYQEPPPVDYSLGAAAHPQPEISSMFLPHRTAADKLGVAMQEFVARGGKLEDFAKLIGQSRYLGQVDAGTPDGGMPFMPLFGQTPTTNTALTTQRQDAISARDADEALRQATAVERIRGDNSARVASINQAGADRRHNASIASRERLAQLRLEVGNDGRVRSTAPGSKPPAVPALSGPLATKMREQLEVFLGNEGYEVDPQALDILFTEAARLYQDPNSDAFKNPVVAAANIVTMLQQGQVAGVGTERRGKGWFDGEPRDAVVRKHNATGAIQAARSIKWTGDPKKDRAMVEALPSGTRFIGPDGVERIRK